VSRPAARWSLSTPTWDLVCDFCDDDSADVFAGVSFVGLPPWSPGADALDEFWGVE